MSFIFVSEEHSEGGYNIYGMEVEEIENCSRPQDVTFNVSDSIVVATIVDSVSTNTQYEYVYGIGDSVVRRTDGTFTGNIMFESLNSYIGTVNAYATVIISH